MEQILQELTGQAKKQLFYYPETTPKQDIKYYVKRIVRRKHTPKRDAFFWPHALLTQGLETVGELETLKKYFDIWIDKGLPIQNIDNAMNGYSLLYVYEETKEEKYKKAAERLYEYLVQYSNCMNNTMPYRKGAPYHVYVDGVGMIAPFLCRYGALFENQDAITLGIKQICDFLKFGMDEATKLPYHGYDLKTEVKYGIIGWGRSLGWLLLAIVDSIEYIPEGRERQEMVDVLGKLMKASLQYVRGDGYFSWQLAAMEGPKDTSATAMIGYALLRSRKYFLNENIVSDEVLDRIEAALINSCKNGMIYDCSGECHGYSQYPQIYGAYPWSLGSGLRFLWFRMQNKMY